MLRYIEAERLPLWVEYVPIGLHDDRLFHNHEFSEIALVLQGSAIHLLDGASAEIKQGDILVLHPGVSHAYDHAGEMELVNLVYDRKKLSLPILDGYSLPMFDTFFPTDEPSSSLPSAAPVMTLNEHDLKTTFQIVQRLEDELKSFKPGNSFLGLALFMEVIALLARHDASTTPEHQFRFQIGEVIGFLHRNYKRHLEVDELVAVAKMSRRNLFRKFKVTTGHTPIDYLLQIRLQQAAQMLLRTKLTVSEIAAKCGFRDSNYLCRLFRQHLKTSPRQFRRGHTEHRGSIGKPAQS
jgi:AraC-like DNA-binding protein